MFGSCKIFFRKWIFSGNVIFGKGKCIQTIWLNWNSFYRKSIPMFGSFKHFYSVLRKSTGPHTPSPTENPPPPTHQHHTTQKPPKHHHQHHHNNNNNKIRDQREKDWEIDQERERFDLAWRTVAARSVTVVRAWGFGRRDRWFDLEAVAMTGVGGGL